MLCLANRLTAVPYTLIPLPGLDKNARLYVFRPRFHSEACNIFEHVRATRTYGNNAEL